MTPVYVTRGVLVTPLDEVDAVTPRMLMPATIPRHACLLRRIDFLLRIFIDAASAAASRDLRELRARRRRRLF